MAALKATAETAVQAGRVVLAVTAVKADVAVTAETPAARSAALFTLA